MEFVSIVFRTKKAVGGYMDTLTCDMARTKPPKYFHVDSYLLVCHLAALQLLSGPVFLLEETGTPLLCIRHEELGRVAHAFSSSAQETEAAKSLSLRSARATQNLSWRGGSAVALPENPGLFPNTQTAVHSCPFLQFKGIFHPLLASGHCVQTVHRQHIQAKSYK